MKSIELTEEEARTIIISLDIAWGEGATGDDEMRPIGQKIKEIYPEIANEDHYGWISD